MEAKTLLRFPHKEIRARAISDYMKEAGYTRAVCFSCGHAAQELEKVGVDVLHIGKRGKLTPNQWFTQAEITRDFNGYFDATSGHLPMDLMLNISVLFKRFLQNKLNDVVYVPTGSGETLVCLKLAYPEKKFIAVYNLDEATEYCKYAPLNEMVKLLAEDITFANG